MGIWAPPGMWFEPGAVREERARGREIWMLPDRPPYSGTLAVESLASDPQCLAWQAYRYGIQGLWIEHAADCGTVDDGRGGGRSAATDCLIYSGRPYGVTDRPLGSIRLKRLRRGLQDHACLQLLERRGKAGAGRLLAEQLVPWGGTDACVDNLVSWQAGGMAAGSAHAGNGARSTAAGTCGRCGAANRGCGFGGAAHRLGGADEPTRASSRRGHRCTADSRGTRF